MARNLLVALGACLLFALAAGDGTYPEGPCTAGEVARVDCNTCRCAGDGSGYACTRQACPRTRRGTSCTPGTTRQVDCNTCTCLDNGQEACTLRGCLSQNRTKRGTSCTPGTTRQVDCNTCTCLDNGQEACTLKGCLSQNRTKRAANPLEAGKCKPGTSYKDDCNTCVCGPDGDMSSAACTLIACPPTLTLKPKDEETPLEAGKCKPGSSYKDDCNTCVCGPDGDKSLAACTLLACFPANPLEPGKCKPGTSYKDDCNTCLCGPDGDKSSAVCTLAECPPTLTLEPKKEETPLEAGKCKPGSSYKDDCNTCVCGPNGDKSSAACTLLACFPEPPLEAGKCKPGSSYKDDCNTCVCGPNGDKSSAACTLLACFPAN